jgi:hypothetical protein
MFAVNYSRETKRRTTTKNFLFKVTFQTHLRVWPREKTSWGAERFEALVLGAMAEKQ